MLKSRVAKEEEEEEEHAKASADDASSQFPSDGLDRPPPPPKPGRISVHCIVKRNLDEAKDAKEWTQEAIAKAVGELTHVRLDRENIGDLDGLEVLGTSVRCLYLQHNHIRAIENLEFLANLRFLALQHNNIRRVENLTCLCSLGLLDISHNMIEQYDVGEFPKSLVILNLQGNPCTSLASHRSDLVAALPKLRQLDGTELSVKSYDEESDDNDVTLVDDDEDNDEPIVRLHDEFESSHAWSQDDHWEGSSKQGVFSALSAAMIARSQSRLVELEREHDLHLRELEAIRGRLGIYLDGERPESGSHQRHIGSST